MAKWVRSFRDLDVWQRGFELAHLVGVLSRSFPKDEMYSLTNQIRRSSRSVCANAAEAWAKRRYPAHFSSKLTDCQGEAMETQNWLLFSQQLGYAPKEAIQGLIQDYDQLIASFDRMIDQADQWKNIREEK